MAVFFNRQTNASVTEEFKKLTEEQKEKIESILKKKGIIVEDWNGIGGTIDLKGDLNDMRRKGIFTSLEVDSRLGFHLHTASSSYSLEESRENVKRIGDITEILIEISKINHKIVYER